MKILLVEDTEKLRTLVHKGLTAEGHVVDTLDDGQKALLRISLYHDTYDVIILDLGLPTVDGSDIVPEIRKKKIHTPIIVITARDAIADKVTLLTSGADDYLTKPFNFEELLARIHAVSRRPAAVTDPVRTHKGLTLNTTMHTCTYNGDPVPLSRKELLLLEYFMSHVGAAVTRDQLLAHAWDFNEASQSNVVDAHVKNLRNKLKHHTHEEYITTVRGVGYRLAA